MSDKLTEKTVKLDTPIMRGKTEITEIVLRKPQSGALRGTVCRPLWIWTWAR
ncbi:phage tail protein E [Salmonella enterica subsp. enterica]|uniref:Phage tail protein E n=1 Tax=Salmonella enterica I TaxID=59201 RepID=A0A379UV71_SALET|nr:phage tail protein E [Salmonella enterica subsp. enterica]